MIKDIKNGLKPIGHTKPDWSIDGRELPVYRVPISQLFYNDENGRIATWMTGYKNINGDDSLLQLSTEDFNDLIHEFIKQSNNKTSFTSTYNDIREKGQIRPGVILNDGRVVSGNRRFTVLRELYKNTGNDKYAYFECFIIDKNLSNIHERKEIKTIERLTQFGVDEKVDYEPIDRLVDVYNDLIGPRKIWTLTEYQKKLNLDKTKLNLMYHKARFMADYLEYIGKPEHFYIARTQKLDGSLQEIANTFKNMEQPEWDRIKSVFYAYFSVEGDKSKVIRGIIKTYKQNPKEFGMILNKVESDIEAKELENITNNVDRFPGTKIDEDPAEIPTLKSVLTKDTINKTIDIISRAKVEKERQDKITKIEAALETVYIGLKDTLGVANDDEKERINQRLRLAKKTIDLIIGE